MCRSQSVCLSPSYSFSLPLSLLQTLHANSTNSKLCFSILSPNKCLHLRAPSENDRELWIFGLQQVLAEYHKPIQLFTEGQFASQKQSFEDGDQSDPLAFPEREAGVCLLLFLCLLFILILILFHRSIE